MEASPSKRPRLAGDKDARRVAFDVSGTIVKLSRASLAYLGRCDFIERMEDVNTDEAIELDYPMSIFDDFHCALVAARRDVLKAMKLLHTALETPRGVVLKDLLDYLGYDWLLGRTFEAPQALRMAEQFGSAEGFSHEHGWDIGAVWRLFNGGILRYLSVNQTQFLHGCHGYYLSPLEPGDIPLLGEVKYSNRAHTYLNPVILRNRLVRRVDQQVGEEVEYFIPHIPPSRGKKRWIIDLGPRYLVKLERLVMALASTSFSDGPDSTTGDPAHHEVFSDYKPFPGHFDAKADERSTTDKCSGSICVASGHDVLSPDQVVRTHFSGEVVRRQHSVMTQKRRTEVVKQGSWNSPDEKKTVLVPGQFVKAKNTCSLVHAVVPEQLIPAFVGRLFSIEFDQKFSLYACEIYGTLYEVPENVDVSSSRQPYMFDTLSLGRTTAGEARHLRQVELEKLRIAELVTESGAEESASQSDGESDEGTGDQD